MTKNQICIIFVLLLLLFLLIFSLNFYFLTRLNEQITDSATSNKDIEHRIKRNVKHLNPVYVNRNPRYFLVRNQLIRNFKPSSDYNNVSTIWDIAKWWPNANEVYPQTDETMGALVKALQNEPILSARNSPKGTQLKLLLYLAGNQKVIFKPKWYAIDTIIEGTVYSGKDRHTAEIIGFYLGAVLGLRWTPIVVGRKIDLTQIYSVADSGLKKTISVDATDENTTYCLFGKCYYCKETEPVCGDENNSIDGVVLLVVPGTLAKYRSPWQRTYKDDQKADWELNVDYCKSIKSKLSPVRLLDLIDTAIFDFLTQNGDRHHYETRDDRVILIDNGKGFGNPKLDFLDILAPLYQCCWLRKSTWERLLYYSGGTLSEILEQLTKFDQLYPILSKEHFNGINRRLMFIYSAVEMCMEKYGTEVLR